MNGNGSTAVFGGRDDTRRLASLVENSLKIYDEELLKTDRALGSWSTIKKDVLFRTYYRVPEMRIVMQTLGHVEPDKPLSAEQQAAVRFTKGIAMRTAAWRKGDPVWKERDFAHAFAGKPSQEDVTLYVADMVDRYDMVPTPARWASLVGVHDHRIHGAFEQLRAVGYVLKAKPAQATTFVERRGDRSKLTHPVVSQRQMPLDVQVSLMTFSDVLQAWRTFVDSVEIALTELAKRVGQ